MGLRDEIHRRTGVLPWMDVSGIETGENGACYAIASDVEAGINRIFIDEIAFAELIDKQTMPWLLAV